MYCEKVPKGFEKYYKKDRAAGAGASAAKSAGAQQSEEKSAKEEPKPSRSSSRQTSPPKNDWGFGMFSPSQQSSGGGGGGKSGGSGQGRPIGGEGPEKDKIMLFGAITGIAIVAALAFYEMGYKEIAWKEFVNK